VHRLQQICFDRFLGQFLDKEIAARYFLKSINWNLYLTNYSQSPTLARLSVFWDTAQSRWCQVRLQQTGIVKV